jgi:hypothetical protein
MAAAAADAATAAATAAAAAATAAAATAVDYLLHCLSEARPPHVFPD